MRTFKSMHSLAELGNCQDACLLPSAHLEAQPHLALLSPPHLQSVPQLQDPLLVCEAHLQPVRWERERDKLEGH